MSSSNTLRKGLNYFFFLKRSTQRSRRKKNREMVSISMTTFLKIKMWKYIRISELKFFLFVCLGATPVAYGSSQAKGEIGAIAEVYAPATETSEYQSSNSW